MDDDRFKPYENDFEVLWRKFHRRRAVQPRHVGVRSALLKADTVLVLAVWDILAQN